MHEDARDLGLEICRVRPDYEVSYEEPDHVEFIRRKNTPFETLMEQAYPGCLSHALEFVEQLRNLGLKVEYYQKRKPHAVERINAGIFVNLCGDDQGEIRLAEVSDSGHLICRSVETRKLKSAFVKHVISLSSEFDVPLQFDHDEWLFTAAEMDSVVYNRGYANIEEALAKHPSFAPFVSVEISKVLPGRMDRWIGLVKQLLMDIEQKHLSGEPVSGGAWIRGDTPGPTILNHPSEGSLRASDQDEGEFIWISPHLVEAARQTVRAAGSAVASSKPIAGYPAMFMAPADSQQEIMPIGFFTESGQRYCIGHLRRTSAD